VANIATRGARSMQRISVMEGRQASSHDGQQAGKLGQAALSGVLGGRDRPVPIRFGKLFKGDPINITMPIYEIAVRRSLLHIVAPTPVSLHMNDKPGGGGLIENSRADNK
jgi:hypothetical protein